MRASMRGRWGRRSSACLFVVLTADIIVGAGLPLSCRLLILLTMDACDDRYDGRSLWRFVAPPHLPWYDGTRVPAPLPFTNDKTTNDKHTNANTNARTYCYVLLVPSHSEPIRQPGSYGREPGRPDVADRAELVPQQRGADAGWPWRPSHVTQAPLPLHQPHC